MAEDLDLLTFTPLYADQDEETILARWRAWANEGRDPEEDVDQWTDTREGSIWWLCTTPGRREDARIYDLMGTEVLASVFPQWSWGEYLDDQGEVRDIGRKVATPAGGTVTFTGTPLTVIPAGTTVTTEPADPDEEVPEFQTIETVAIADATFPFDDIDVGVVAVEPGESGNVASGAVTVIPTAIPGVNSVTNADPMEGGTDVESDSAFRSRILESFVGVAVANQLYYRRIVLAVPGVGRVTVIPVASGAGTIQIIVATAAGEPVAPAVVDAVQALVDPVAGEGAGQGQVGATITVETATTLDIDVGAVIEFEDGYSLEPASGLIDLRPTIEASIAAYLATVQSGGEVVRQQVGARIMRLTGVHDLKSLTLNGGTVNIAIASSPPKVPVLDDTASITEGAVP